MQDRKNTFLSILKQTTNTLQRTSLKSKSLVLFNKQQKINVQQVPYVYNIKNRLVRDILKANYYVVYRLPEMFEVHTPYSFEQAIENLKDNILKNFSNSQIYWSIEFGEIKNRMELGNIYSLSDVYFNLLINDKLLTQSKIVNIWKSIIGVTNIEDLTCLRRFKKSLYIN